MTLANIIFWLQESLMNPWVVFGFAAQIIFFLRFVVQMLATEKNKRTTIPVSFWYLSIVGAIMILIYAIYRQDIVFIVGQGLSLLIYVRNLFIYYQSPDYVRTPETLQKSTGSSPEVAFISIAGIFLAILAGLLFYSVNNHKNFSPPLFTSIDALEALWNEYKAVYVEEGSGRTLDKSRDFITTSEGQSYTMLRAVWMDDEETFEEAWDWTKDILLRDDFLFAWKFGQLSDGTYGILTEEGGGNTATDGDTDIALALFLAYGRWGNEVHLNEGRAIINSVWENEVVSINGRPYLLANNLEKDSVDPWMIMNVSYLSPYAYKVFAKIDTTHDWNALVDTSYEVIQQSSRLPLDTEYSVWLPPNWIEINRLTGDIRAPEDSALDTDFGYDALRMPWRLAMDWNWYGDERAVETLQDFWYLEKLWNESGMLPSVIAHDGTIVAPEEKIEMYGAVLPYFMITNEAVAKEMYTNKIINEYNRNTFLWRTDPGYYGTNWGWFGIAYYNNRLPNYTERFTE